MAILANRTKNNNSFLEFLKFLLVILRRSVVFLLIIISILIFIYSPAKLSSLSLEITGHCASASLAIYETIFDKISIITQKLRYFDDLTYENIKLKLEIARLKQQQTNLESMKSENDGLKQLFHVVGDKDHTYVTAKLLSVSVNPLNRIAILDAGTKHGVEMNQIVTNKDGLIGRIVTVSDNYSKIMLVNDINSRIPVKSSLSREEGILQGAGDYSQITYLQKNHLIQHDEAIITSGSGNIYPSGLVVGFVHKVTGDNVVVRPIADDLSSTEFVTILSYPKE